MQQQAIATRNEESTSHNPATDEGFFRDCWGDEAMRFTPTEIATIKRLRRSRFPWPVVAKELKATILEVRTAIGLPTYLTPERKTLPWDTSQQTLPFGL